MIRNSTVLRVGTRFLCRLLPKQDPAQLNLLAAEIQELRAHNARLIEANTQLYIDGNMTRLELMAQIKFLQEKINSISN